MECTSCGAEITEILARHEYTIRLDEEQDKGVKEEGEVIYSCGNCLQMVDTCDIEDALKQVDEL